ncbi:MAG: glycosyltransferase 87 family protein, partial [Myxococcales bacterium]
GDATRAIHRSPWAGGAIILLALFTFALIQPGDGTTVFLILLALAAVGYFATLRQIAKGLRPSGRALLACAVVAAAWRVPLLLLPPEPGADLRRYVWDAHLVRAGQSPYRVVPADPAFAHLRTVENWPVNNPDVPSPYPPGAQLFFLAATAVHESALAIKVAALICDALLAFVVWRWLGATGANPGWVLAYLWNPLVSLEVARHGHVDVVGTLCLALAALALVRGRSLLASVGFALSVAVKPLPIVLLPLFWRRISRRDLAAGIAVLIALYLPFWDGRGFPIGSVPQVVERFRFNGPIFAALASGAGPGAAAALATVVGLTAAALARRWLSVASPQGWAWPMAATLLCAPLVYPWYLVWLTPFVAGAAMMPIAIWTVSILITYVVWQLPAGQWAVPQWALLVEYGALLVAAWWLLWRRKQVTARSASYSTPPA